MRGHSKEEKLQVEVLNKTHENEQIHQDIELLFVLEGELDVTVGEQITHMNSEDILVINANKRHSINGSENVLYARLFINYQLVSDIYESSDIMFWCNSTKGNNERYDELRDTLKKLLNHYLSTRGTVADFGHIALCYRVMDLLSIHFLVRTGGKDAEDDKQNFENRMTQINNYIRANYEKSISLSDLATQLYLSEGYLSRFFKKNYGMSFLSYVTSVRLYHAMDDLLYTEHPITRIAFDNGFSNVGVFNKAFKNAYGETPSAFRKSATQTADDQGLSETDRAIEKRLENYLRNDGIRQEEQHNKGDEETVFSAQKFEQIKCCWNDMINVGSADDLLKSEIREHIILLKESLDFKYVRFWSPFSKTMLIDVHTEDGSYNFSRLDNILDFLIEHDLKPHIEIGMKPRRVHENIEHTLIFEQGDDVYPGDEKWRSFLGKWMSHLVHRYGRAEVSNWRLELWFRERQKWTAKDVDDYLELFDITYEEVHEKCDGIKLGGSGFRLDSLQKISDERFFEKWSYKKHLPDFFSCLYFAYERGAYEEDIYSKRITDNEGLLHSFEKFKKLIPNNLKDKIPIYFTEWNLTISDRNYMNDTCFKGAYIVKNIIDVYGSCDSLALFQGSDRFSEFYDSGDMLHGGTGILTRDGIFKPAGFAFEFFNRLFGGYLGKSANCLATTDGHDNFGIICHNQKKLNYNYYFTAENEIDRENIWKYFEDRDSLEIKLSLTDVKNGVYQMKVYSINESNGSVLDVWREMEYEKELTRNDIKYFRRVCEPKLRIQKIKAENNVLRVSLNLAANEIAFIRLKLFSEEP